MTDTTSHIFATGKTAGNGARGSREALDPLLVSLHDHFLAYQKGKRTDTDILYAVVDILDADLNDKENILAAEVIIDLIRQVEQDIRASIAAKLAPRDDLHHTLLHALVYDEIAVAEPVLRYSPLLSTTDLLLIIQSQPAAYWQAIAKRNAIESPVIGALVEKAEEHTILNLLENRSIRMEDSQLSAIVKLAAQSEMISTTLSTYKALPKNIVVELYWQVSISLREKILKNFDIDPQTLDKTMEDTVQDFADTMLSRDTMTPSSHMRELAQHYKAAGKIDGDMLVSTLRRREGRFFIALFSYHTGLGFETIWDMLCQTGGQALANVCRVSGIDKDDFVSVFLLGRAMARPSLPVTAKELQKAMAHYDSIIGKISETV